MVRIRLPAALLLAGGLTLSAGVLAHGEAHGDTNVKEPAGDAEQKAWGIAGDSAKATRTIRIDMTDAMKYTPSVITVRKGETVRFEVGNRGRVMHEMVLGTQQEIERHAAIMRKHPGMEHDEPYMAHVAPGKTQTLVWRFNRHGEFQFACLQPGHYEAGMLGKVIVKN